MPVLYYIRHGETDYNTQGRLQGRRDISLNAHGRRQAAECGVLLGDLFARDHRQAQDLKYVSSPLKRARETMGILRATLGLQAHHYEIDARLMEIAYGEWEGLTLQEIERRNASILSARERDKWDFAPPGGESYRELADRIGNWYRSLTADTVVAAHGGGVRALMAISNIVPRSKRRTRRSPRASFMFLRTARCRATLDRTKELLSKTKAAEQCSAAWQDR